jgi:hypothetical protein
LKIFEFEENFKKRWFLKSKKKTKKYSKCKNPKLAKKQKIAISASFDNKTIEFKIELKFITKYF